MKILNKLSKIMPASLFRAGILSLAVSAVVYILCNIIDGDFSVLSLILYNGYFQGILLLLICGLLIQVKNVSYKIISIPYFVVFAWRMYNIVFNRLSFSAGVWIYVIFDVLMLCAVFCNVYKELLVGGCIVFGIWVCFYDFGYYMFNTIRAIASFIFGNGLDLRDIIYYFLSLLYNVTFYFGLIVVMKRTFEYKSENKRKAERVNKQPTAKEELIELKIRLDAGEIDKEKYDVMRKDVIDKL